MLQFTLNPYLIILIVKQGGIKYHFLSLWYDCHWTHNANIYIYIYIYNAAVPKIWYIYIYIYIYIFVRARACVCVCVCVCAHEISYTALLSFWRYKWYFIFITLKFTQQIDISLTDMFYFLQRVSIALWVISGVTKDSICRQQFCSLSNVWELVKKKKRKGSRKKKRSETKWMNEIEGRKEGKSTLKKRKKCE